MDELLSALSQATFGAELELADVNTDIILPAGDEWCFQDGSICNSDGFANDPKKLLNKFGGEIKVKPCGSPAELLRRVKALYAILGVSDSSFNYTTNLHAHIRVPGLKDHLKGVQAIAAYVQQHGKKLFEAIAVNPPVSRADYPSDEEFAGAHKRYLRRFRSHQHTPSAREFSAMMKATTTQEFYEAHFRRSRDGKILRHLLVRSGVNLAALWEETETIEFRHFTMSPDMECMFSAFLWPFLFLRNIFSGYLLAPQELVKVHSLKFQPFYKYDYEMDKVFQQTNVYHNSRASVKGIYKSLLESI